MRRPVAAALLAYANISIPCILYLAAARASAQEAADVVRPGSAGGNSHSRRLDEEVMITSPPPPATGLPGQDSPSTLPAWHWPHLPHHKAHPPMLGPHHMHWPHHKAHSPGHGPHHEHWPHHHEAHPPMHGPHHEPPAVHPHINPLSPLAHPLAPSFSHISGSEKAASGVLWQDTFDGTTLDTTNWTPDLGNGKNGWGNGEQEYYTAEAATVSGGYLHITASKSASGQYQSAKIITASKHFWAPTATYPTIRIEASIQMPEGGIGIWPAFWMMPETSTYGGWPASGEIDIMEAVDSLSTLYGTIHYGTSSPGKSEGGSTKGSSPLTQGFHTYGIDWSTTAMTFKLDGVAYKTVNCACAGTTTGNCGKTDGWYSTVAGAGPCAPFDKPFYIILNLAIGGNWPGDVTAATVLPQTMLVDWVRVSSI